jgi:hypothetical protein
MDSPVGAPLALIDSEETLGPHDWQAICTVERKVQLEPHECWH